MRTILFLVRKEAVQVLRDKVMRVQIFLIPVVQLVVLANAATFEVRQTPMHVVDLDHSPASRRLVEAFSATGRFRVARTSPSVALADRDLLARRAGLILEIPYGFERDLTRKGAVSVGLVLDAENGAAAGIILSYANAILSDFAAERNAALRPAVRDRHRHPAPHLAVRTRAWYNAELSYTHYMVPGLLVILVTIVGTLMTAQNITREKELGTIEQLNVTPITRSQFIAGKLIPFWIIGLIELSVGLALAKLIFDIPMRGSLGVVFLAAAVYLVAALGLGLWISTFTRTQQQAQFVTFFILMLYLFMSGLFTPIDSMPLWAQHLAQLSPVKHFVWLMRAVLVRGGGLAEVSGALLALGLFALAVLTLAVRQYSKTTA